MWHSKAKKPDDAMLTFKKLVSLHAGGELICSTGSGLLASLFF